MKKIAICLLLLIGTAACPAMSPVGAPSNPAGVASDKSDSGSTTSSGTSTGTSTGDASDSTTDGSLGGTSGTGTGGGGGSSIDGSPYTVAREGTFAPKADNEAVEVRGQKGAKDWRLLFVYGSGVNDWWELHKAPPELYPIFKDSTTADFKMRLEALMPDCGCWMLGERAVHMVYQPKGQPPPAPQSLDAMPNLLHLLLEGYTLSFPSLPLGEGTVIFSVENEGGSIPLGSLTTYYPSVDSESSAPISLP